MIPCERDILYFFFYFFVTFPRMPCQKFSISRLSKENNRKKKHKTSKQTKRAPFLRLMFVFCLNTRKPDGVTFLFFLGKTLHTNSAVNLKIILQSSLATKARSVKTEVLLLLLLQLLFNRRKSNVRKITPKRFANI